MASKKTKRSIGVGLAMLIVLATTSVLLSRSKEYQAQQILRQVFLKYKSMSSYSSAGTTVMQVGDGRSLTSVFSMQLGRSNYYLIEYEQHAPTFTNKGAVWADGTGDYFANDMAGPSGTASKSPYPNALADNLNDISDISGGVSVVVPAIFFRPLKRYEGVLTWIKKMLGRSQRDWSEWTDPAKWSRLSLATEQEGKVGNIDCHVLTAELRGGHALLWIGKSDFLIHRSEEWFKSKDSETTEQQLTNLFQNGMKAPLPIEEMKRRINEGQKTADATMKPVTVVFADKSSPPPTNSSMLMSITVNPPTYRVYTQTHENIVLNQKFAPTNFSRANVPVTQKN